MFSFYCIFSKVEKFSSTLRLFYLVSGTGNTRLYLYGVVCYQLPFCKADCFNFRLEIIGKPTEDPEWWKARNERGVVGLVPRNYVQVIDDSTPAATVTDYDR